MNFALHIINIVVVVAFICSLKTEKEKLLGSYFYVQVYEEQKNTKANRQPKIQFIHILFSNTYDSTINPIDRNEMLECHNYEKQSITVVFILLNIQNSINIFI